jgi:phosphoglycerate dehydrogenase-like enzyme
MIAINMEYLMTAINRPKILVITPILHIEGLIDKLKNIGDVTYLPDPTEEEVLNNVKRMNVIFTNPNKSKVYLGEKVISAAENLGVICTASTGTVHIDLKETNNSNIKVISLTVEYGTIRKITSTAEHAFTLMMASLRNLVEAIDSVREGEWDYEKFIGRQLNQLNVGVVGYGRLGAMFANYCRAFGSRVIVYDPYKKVEDTSVEQVDSLDELSCQSDVISLHIHVTNETRKIIGARLLQLAKKDVRLINTSRGEVVDEDAIVEFLKNNTKAKYFTDVISGEIHSKTDSPVLNHFKSEENRNQICITPHIGGMTTDAQLIAYHRVADMLDNFFKIQKKE